MTKHVGKIVEVTPTSTRSTATRRTVTVEMSGRAPKQGATVELRVVDSDEEIGQKFREELCGTENYPIDRESITDLAQAIEDAGWSGLAELVRDVGY